MYKYIYIKSTPFLILFIEVFFEILYLNIAMENARFEDVFPIENADFGLLC